MSFRISRALLQRALPEDGEGLSQYLQRELVPLVFELLRVLTAAPTPFAWLANAATLDVSRGSDFVASAQLTGDSTLTLSNGYDGAQGTIVVQQDSSGGHLLSFVVTGGTVVREDPSVDSNPKGAPGSLTRYRYLFATVNAAPYLIIERLYLL